MARLISQTTRGPVFRPATVRAWTADVTREVYHAAAEYALWRLRGYNAADFRYNAGPKTGMHSRGYHLTTRGYGQVTNSAVSASWLEGTGSRNARSRFKGYHHWRRATADVERAARRIADSVVARAIRALS